MGSALDPPAREGSPLNGAGRTNIFAADADEKEDEDERQQVSFGERLRAGKDAEEEDSDDAVAASKVELTEQEGKQ